jgi:hypothetical protein
MNDFLVNLRKRNGVLYWFGCLNILLSILCIFLSIVDERSILNENAWKRPLNYYIYSCITLWSLGWLIDIINSKKYIRLLSWVLAISILIESTLVFIQSYKGEKAFLDVTSPSNLLIQKCMMVLDFTFCISIFLIVVLLFAQKKMPVSQHYTWGVRKGVLIFFLFTALGFYLNFWGDSTAQMNKQLSILSEIHWNQMSNHSRVSLMMGLFSLQLIPLTSNYALKKKNQVIFFSIIYFLLALLLFFSFQFNLIKI